MARRLGSAAGLVTLGSAAFLAHFDAALFVPMQGEQVPLARILRIESIRPHFGIGFGEKEIGIRG